MNEFLTNNFKLFYSETLQKSPDLNFDFLSRGLVLDFVPSEEDVKDLLAIFPKINFETLFSFKEEFSLDDVFNNIVEQITHYVGFNNNFVEFEGVKIPLTKLSLTNKEHLQEILVTDILYKNKPFKDTQTLCEVVLKLDLKYDINTVLNNEAKVCLYTEKQIFFSGDDAVRYIVYKSTQSPLLIKSKEVLYQIDFSDNDFLQKHKFVLSQVFNRHKKILIALKIASTNLSIKNTINTISKLSKLNHIPLKESYKKTFVNDFLKNGKFLEDKLSIKDLFKGLELCGVKTEKKFYKIRNGKIFYKDANINNLELLENRILEALENKLSFLKDKNILLDEYIDYGLPISKKQTFGNLPINTKILLEKNASVGIYWKNNYGVRDLDLSAIIDNVRIGWGGMSAFINNNLLFSGDITNAPNGAFEFLTTKDFIQKPVSFVINNYCGDESYSCDFVVGNSFKKQWIEEIKIKENQSFSKKGIFIGFLQDNIYTLRNDAYSSSMVSSATNPMTTIFQNKFYTIKELFDKINVKYSIKKDDSLEYDFDLRYENMSFDKLEKLFED